jgi:hypothetical protein
MVSVDEKVLCFQIMSKKIKKQILKSLNKLKVNNCGLMFDPTSKKK